MKRKVILLIISLAIIINSLVVAGCNTEGEAVDNTLQNEDTSPDTFTEAIKTEECIFDREQMYFTVVRSVYAENVTVDAVKDIVAAFRDMSAGEWNTSINDDFVKGQTRESVYEIEGKEILVGLTNRKESQDVYATLAKDEYAIRFVGDKLVIIGYDDYATAAAVVLFIDTYLPKRNIDSLAISRDVDIKGESSLRKIAVNAEAKYRIMTWNLGLSVGEPKNGDIECIDIIVRHLPDIIGLQECNADVHSKVLKHLPDFYAFANKKHNNSATVNYTPILYNTELFTLLKSDVVWLRGRYTGTNTKSLSWAVFEDKEGAKFALINYHGAVCSNSYSGFENYTSDQLNQQALEWKLDNVVQVLEIKDAIVAEFGAIPIMVSGDNNFNNTSQPYKNLVGEGFEDAEVTARVSRTTGYRTSYSYGSVPGSGASIDHVFGINGVDFVVHDIVRGDDVWKASDHCPVYVDFNLTK